MKVWYLYHSAFALETQHHFFIFDYFQDHPKGGGLADGVIDPKEIAAKGKPVAVFVSHSHGDHYHPLIFRWRESLPDIRYILSPDIDTREECLRVAPGERLDLGDITVEALRSNDQGVAWYIQTDGHSIYHAGDLHWWRWEGEPEDWNDGMEWSYKDQCKRLEGRPMDLAFLPLDPRQEGNYLLGMDWFVRVLHPKFVLPMHFGDKPEISHRLQQDPAAGEYRSCVGEITHRGQEFLLP